MTQKDTPKNVKSQTEQFGDLSDVNFSFAEGIPTLDGQAMDGSHIIDNNTNVNYGYNVGPAPIPVKKEVGEFVLMLRGKVWLHGNETSILNEVKAILYGEHPNPAAEGATMDDLVIFKKMKIKVGVFFDG